MSEATFDIGENAGDGFDALMDAKVSAALADTDGADTAAEVETAAEVTPAERARDEQGRYTKAAAAEDSVETEPAAEDTAEDTTPETAEDLEVLRRRLAEKDEFIGRLTNEVGESRKLLEQVAAQQQQISQQAARLQIDEDALIDQIAAHPAIAEAYARQAFTSAVNSGDWDDYDTVIDAWAEADPRGARRYERHVNTWLAQQQAAAQTAPLQQTARETQNAKAVANVGTKYPDFEQVLGGITHVPPILDHALTSAQDAATYESALDTLYHYAKSVQTGPLKDATKKAVQEAEQDARQAKIEATVASAAKTPTREGKTAAQDQLAELLSVNEPFKDAWSTEAQAF